MGNTLLWRQNFFSTHSWFELYSLYITNFNRYNIVFQSCWKVLPKNKQIYLYVLTFLKWLKLTRTHNHLVCKRTLKHLAKLNGSVFVYQLSGCRFKSSCSHLNFSFGTCFEQGVPWHSGNYRVWSSLTFR